MMQVQFGTFGHGFVGQPAFKEVFLEDIPFLGQKFFRSVRENHANAFDIQGLDVVGQFKVQILNGEVGQALTAMDRRAYFRVSFEEKRGKSGSGSMQGSRTATRAGTDDHDVVHLFLLAWKGGHGSP